VVDLFLIAAQENAAFLFVKIAYDTFN